MRSRWEERAIKRGPRKQKGVHQWHFTFCWPCVDRKHKKHIYNCTVMNRGAVVGPIAIASADVSALCKTHQIYHALPEGNLLLLQQKLEGQLRVKYSLNENGCKVLLRAV